MPYATELRSIRAGMGQQITWFVLLIVAGLGYLDLLSGPGAPGTAPAAAASALLGLAAGVFAVRLRDLVRDRAYGSVGELLRGSGVQVLLLAAAVGAVAFGVAVAVGG